MSSTDIKKLSLERDRLRILLDVNNAIASRLGLKRTTLQSKLKKLGIGRHSI